MNTRGRPEIAARAMAWTESHWAWIILAAITCLAGVPRFFNLGGASLWNDEASTSLLALTAMKNGVPAFPSGTLPLGYLLFDYKPLYAMVEGLSFRFLGVSPFAARFPSALLGVAMVPMAFLLARRAGGSYVGIALAIMVAFSTEYIGWSRQAEYYILFTDLLLGLALLASSWSAAGARARRIRGALVATALLAMLFLAGPGLFILYVPGMVGGLIAYVVVQRRAALLNYFGLRKKGELDTWSLPALGTIEGRRLILVLSTIVAIVTLILVAAYLGLFSLLFSSLFHVSPYPFVWYPLFGNYVLNYYPFVVAFGILGVLVVLRRFKAFEIAMLIFVLLVFLTLSSAFSLIGNLPSGEPPIFERYLIPLLVFIFYFAAVGIVELGIIASRSFRSLRSHDPQLRPIKLAAVAVGVSALLLVPGVVYPGTLNTYPIPQFSTADNLVPWNPFSVFPAQPSAIYWTPDPNYQLASDYVLDHRAPNDVVMAIYPEVPAFYLGKIQYWIFSNPPTGSTIVLPNGTSVYYLYYLTGSVAVQNVPDFESILMNHSGWVVVDAADAGALGPNLTLAVTFLTDFVPAASDVTISLYHWNVSSPSAMLESIWRHRIDLQAALGTNFTRLVDWAAVSGVTIDSLRPVLLPLEGFLVNNSDAAVKPLAVLINVFNHRPDLQSQFPETMVGNYTALLEWAKEVVTGVITDPAYSTLEPYAQYYINAG